MTKLWEVSDETSTLYRYRSENGDIISRGASRHSNPRSPPPKHAYYLPHSSPSTPSTTNSNSPATAFQKALEHDQEAAVTQLHYAHPRPHQALTPASTTLKRNNNVTTISHREIVSRLWDHPSLRGRSRHSTPHSKKRIAPVSYNVLGFFPIQERVNFNTRSYINISLSPVCSSRVCVSRLPSPMNLHSELAKNTGACRRFALLPTPWA